MEKHQISSDSDIRPSHAPESDGLYVYHGMETKGFTPFPFYTKNGYFKQTIPKTAYIKTLEIFPSVWQSLSIETSASRSIRNQSSVCCS